MPERESSSDVEIRLTTEPSMSVDEGSYTFTTGRSCATSNDVTIESPRPRNYRETVLELYPNVSPLLDLMSRNMRHEPTSREQAQERADLEQMPITYYETPEDPTFEWRMEAGEIPMEAIQTETSTVYPRNQNQSRRFSEDEFFYPIFAANPYRMGGVQEAKERLKPVHRALPS